MICYRKNGELFPEIIVREMKSSGKIIFKVIEDGRYGVNFSYARVD